MLLHTKRGNGFIWFTLLFTVSCANAGVAKDAAYTNNFEVSAAGGFGWYNTSNSNLEISSFETDSIKAKHASTNGTWKVGVGYYFFKNQLPKLPYLTQLLFEMNLYQNSTTLSGNVWQYGFPQFNNYTFKSPVTSTRLMWDLKPGLFTWKTVSPYAILGIGAVWNSLSYDETVTGPNVNPFSTLSLARQTTTHVAYELGAGFSFALTDNISATAEYIYAFLGKGSPAFGHINNVNLVAAPGISLQTQNLLFGLSLKL